MSDRRQPSQPSWQSGYSEPTANARNPFANNQTRSSSAQQDTSATDGGLTPTQILRRILTSNERPSPSTARQNEVMDLTYHGPPPYEPRPILKPASPQKSRQTPSSSKKVTFEEKATQTPHPRDFPAKFIFHLHDPTSTKRRTELHLWVPSFHRTVTRRDPFRIDHQDLDLGQTAPVLNLINELNTNNQFDYNDAKALEWDLHYKRIWDLRPARDLQRPGPEWEAELRVYGKTEEKLVELTRGENWARWISALVEREVGGWIVEADGDEKKVRGKVYQWFCPQEQWKEKQMGNRYGGESRGEGWCLVDFGSDMRDVEGTVWWRE
ncbi:hypothetical protein QBC40DRAFT_346326 [Triangularia verruculosa]|uniref:Uncharacterized protein n=1 Tax=Triangularia verruculosa TaxID=2587418 RepID=A0AAN6XN67_9PEZI|nr:hypothetical protein QBC40DRAFT_346326 [Triangularia verruculosa]